MSTQQRAAIIAFISPKGGVGKSLTCLTLAASLTNQGYTARVIDFDQTETLYRWYKSNPCIDLINGLEVEKGPTADIDIDALVNGLWNYSGHDFVFVDLAGHMNRVALLLAAAADITITPMGLDEPDVREAQKLNRELKGMASKMTKPLTHRLLVNKVPFGILPAHQALTLDEVDASDMVRFKNILHLRPILSETWKTGTTPHYADQKRLPVKRAVEEIDAITEELLAVFQPQEERIAA